MARVVRSLDLAEVTELLAWAGRESWNPGLADAKAFAAVDPEGFIGAFVDGQMVAGISALAYDAHFGFIGLYICHPDWRGQGHGKAVWDAGVAHLGNRTIGLDGVPEQQANYASMGFAVAYQSVRMTGRVPVELAPAAGALLPAQLEAVSALDRTCFPARRENFLRQWLSPPNTARMLSTDWQAYAVLRPCLSGYKVGPLFAPDLASATALMTMAAGVGTPVQIDVPMAQTGFLTVLREWNFEPGFNTARMYRGPVPPIAMGKVFGVTSLELG